jgi:multidrug efflux pump subunit AcrA (membrane-fusion protein)
MVRLYEEGESLARFLAIGFLCALRPVFDSYILTLVARMIQERMQVKRRWLWLGALVVTIAVFFWVRSLTRDRLNVHIATAERVPLESTISTNGRVEPEENYEIYSPISTTVKAVDVQPGDQVAAGKLLMVLDDVDALASQAAAESGVKTAQAALDAAVHNGTQQERQAAARRDRGGVSQRSDRGASATGGGGGKFACARTELRQSLFSSRDSACACGLC